MRAQNFCQEKEREQEQEEQFATIQLSGLVYFIDVYAHYNGSARFVIGSRL